MHPRKPGWLTSEAELTLPAVDNQSPILRFGITADGKRSSYRRLRAGVAKPELFLEGEGYGKKWHFNLHAFDQ
jgi:hypothetical protein